MAETVKGVYRRARQVGSSELQFAIRDVLTDKTLNYFKASDLRKKLERMDFAFESTHGEARFMAEIGAAITELMLKVGLRITDNNWEFVLTR